jgi:hypothetical protein
VSAGVSTRSSKLALEALRQGLGYGFYTAAIAVWGREQSGG